MTPNFNDVSPLWSAAAERSGDGALDEVWSQNRGK
jgi:hypothetical protein